MCEQRLLAPSGSEAPLEQLFCAQSGSEALPEQLIRVIGGSEACSSMHFERQVAPVRE